MKTCKRDCVSRYVLRCEKSENLEKVRNYFLLHLWRLARIVELKERCSILFIANCEKYANCGTMDRGEISSKLFWRNLWNRKTQGRDRSIKYRSSRTPSWRPLWRVGDLIKLHCLAELAFLNLHCRVVDTQLAKAFVSDRSNNATVFAFLYFYKRVALLVHFLQFERKGKTNHSISIEIFQLGIRFASTSSKEDETRIIRFLYWFWSLEM